MDKIKLFIFSNTYNSRILLKYLEHVIKNNADFEIILLSEMSVSDHIKLQIKVYETLHQCIEACTQILIVYNSTIPKSKLDLVTSLAGIYHKRCITVGDNLEAKKELYKKTNFNQNFIKKPLILILSYGYHTQPSCWETIIYKLLYEKKIKAFPTPSNELNSVLTWISLCNFKSDYFNNIFTIGLESDVEIRCLQYDSNINSELDNTINQLKPDVIIVTISNNFRNYEEIKNMIKYRCGSIVDAFAKSELLEIIDETGNQKIIFDFSQPCNEGDSIVALNDPLLFHRLSQIILPKIMIPDGVTII